MILLKMFGMIMLDVIEFTVASLKFANTPPCIETLIFLKVSGAESLKISTFTIASLNNNFAGNAGITTGRGTGNVVSANFGTVDIYTCGMGAIIIGIGAIIIGIGPAGVATIILT